MAELYRRKESRFWWMAFVVDGKLHRLSTRKEKLDEAKQVMDYRVAESLKKGLLRCDSQFERIDL